MKLLFDNGPEMIVWTENNKLIIQINELKYELDGSDLFHFASFVYEHKQKVEDELDRMIPISQKIKKLWRSTD